MFLLKIGLLLIASIQVSDPTVTITGRESKIHEFQVVRITSQKQFLETWAKHYGTVPNQLDLKLMPYVSVNFKTHEVVAVFAGYVLESDGLSPVKIIRFFRSNLIIYQQSKYTEFNRAVESHPYAFIVLPRIQGEILVREQIAKLNAPGDYEYSSQERARLAEGK